MREWSATMESSSIQLYAPVVLSFTAEAQAKLGLVEESLQTVDEALNIVERTDERVWEAELYRIWAETLLQQDKQSAAEECYHKALGISRQQRAKSFELRASTGLANLWKTQGQPDQARLFLEKIYDWFTEGFDTPDLIEAKSLLDELS
jgi:predicted ATPase